MLLDPNDFREVLGAGGERFERLMHDLVRTEARRLGIPQNEIHWDQRTNVADGGCDIWVAKAHDNATSFLPNTPTSISLKSGDDGTKPAVFAKEVRDHARLKERLRNGDSYLWSCPRPIDQEKRNAFAAQAKELAVEIGCSETLFKFLWIDAITTRVEESPHLISDHLPAAWRRLEGLTLVKNWRPDDREPVRNEPKWIGFGGRDSVKVTVQRHLLGSTTNRLLHVAGLSGTGKTRTVIEACRDAKSLAEVIYAPTFSGSVDRLLTHLNAVSGSALLIIDELALDDYDSLARRLERSSAAIRVVTIGPARFNEAQRDGILILAPPDSADDVAAVARSAESVLADDVIQSIAHFAGQDLRLALLLVEATVKLPAAGLVPLRDNRDVWARIRRLFAPNITCPNFDHYYGLLTITVDVGVQGKSKDELAYLANHFQEQLGRFEACINDAVRAGLGFMPFEHFEPTPRALAQWLFFDQAWPIIRNRIDIFLHNCPNDRLRKKFVERCQELPENAREEVLATVRGFFLRHFGEPSLRRLRDGQESRFFQTWAETDPEAGLRWLSHAVSSAEAGDLVEFDGQHDYTGGWNGRRQIVWLCEHLSCFKESFYQAEEVLFRLSHVETEKSIANNGTNIWAALFHPLISYTEVPFNDRLALLMSRLRDAEGRSLELVVVAAIAMLGDRGLRAIPPIVVGGRVRPTEWKPTTRGELLDCMQAAGRQFIDAVSMLPRDRQLFVLDRLIPKIGRCFDIGLFEEMRTWTTVLAPGEQTTRTLRQELDRWLSWRDAHTAGNERLATLIDSVRGWRETFEPRTLVDRAKELTSRAYWDHVRGTPRLRTLNSPAEAEREIEANYRSVAAELLEHIEVFADLRTWFESTSNKSSDVLARALAQVDTEGRSYPIVAQWIREGAAILSCAGYLHGLNSVHKRAKVIDTALEHLVKAQPGAALRLSTSGDVTEIGFRRIIRSLVTSKADDLWSLRSLATYGWREILDEQRLLVLTRELRRVQQIEGYREIASAVAFDVLSHIYSDKAIQDPDLAKEALQILSDAPGLPGHNSWEWGQLSKAVQSHAPKAVCRLAIGHLLQSKTGLDESQNSFVVDCARAQPEEVMSAIGEALADKEQRWVFRALVFRELFDAIGVPVVSRYLDTHPDHAVFIARHLASPSIDDKGTQSIPALTDWMMSRFGDDDKVWDEFMMGRHSFEVFAVPEGYEATRKVASQFVSHPEQWVRKWATAEIDDMDRQIELHRREEERRQRQ